MKLRTSRKRARKPRLSPESRQRALLDALQPAEAKDLLGRLLVTRPELLPEIAALAEGDLALVRPERIAEQVSVLLRRLSAEDVWKLRGPSPYDTYGDERDPAWELVERTLAPFLDDLTRRVELGRGEEAVAICRGVLLGLYRVHEEAGESFLDGEGADLLTEAAYWTADRWKKGGRRARPTGSRRDQGFAEMRAFAKRSLPEWSHWLGRVLGTGRAKRRR